MATGHQAGMMLPLKCSRMSADFPGAAQLCDRQVMGQYGGDGARPFGTAVMTMGCVFHIWCP